MLNLCNSIRVVLFGVLCMFCMNSKVFQANSSPNTAPSYSMLRMEKHPAVGGDTAWVSQYGLYDTLSPHLKRFIDGLHAVHTSRLQCKSPIFHFPESFSKAHTHIRWHNHRLLGSSSQSSPNWHASPRCADTSNHRLESFEREPWICDGVRRTQERGKWCVVGVFEVSYPFCRWSFGEMEMGSR